MKEPPFISKNITHKEWLKIKENTNEYDDIYINCPNNYISLYYKNKGSNYIQINNYGLFHTGEDILNFNVPFFEVDTHLRIRTKIHTTCNSKGFIKASVTCSLTPKCIKNFSKSNFSLDDPNLKLVFH
jgi:hypothetical protein